MAYRLVVMRLILSNVFSTQPPLLSSPYKYGGGGVYWIQSVHLSVYPSVILSVLCVSDCVHMISPEPLNHFFFFFQI